MFYIPIYNIIFNTSGTCDYGGHCLALARTIQESTPNALVNCQRGRQGKLLNSPSINFC